MKISGLTTLVLGLSSLVAASAARGQDSFSAPSAAVDPSQAEDQFLVGSMAPRIAANSTVASGFGGYDSARRSPLAGAEVEMAITRWLGLRAGVVYNPLDHANDGARPNLGLRAQILRQESSGVDASVGLAYRQERFTEDGGLYQALVSVGRREERLTSFLNVSYSSDAEGDDFEGELRGASLYRLTTALNLGLQGNYRRDLGSTDSRKGERADPTYDLAVGPVMTYARGGWLFLVQTGVAAVKTSSLRMGALGIGGVGTTF